MVRRHRRPHVAGVVLLVLLWVLQGRCCTIRLQRPCPAIVLQSLPRPMP